MLPAFRTDAGSFCPSISTTMQVSLHTLISLPNLALFFRMITMLRIVDDLTYYVYHQPNYGRQFFGLSLLCWNITNLKWVFGPIQPLYDSIKSSYSRTLPPSETANSPATYPGVGEDVYLLRQTDEYWLFTIPSAVLGFLLFHYLHLLMGRVRRLQNPAKLLCRFQWNGMLVVALFGENIQYLSFRCFSQLYQRGIAAPSGLLNLAVTYSVLFLALLYAAASCALLPLLSRHAASRKLLAEGFAGGAGTTLHLTALSLFKFLAGFAHGMLFWEPEQQVGLLLAMHAAILLLILLDRGLYTRRTILALDIWDRVLRVLLHVLLLVQLKIGVQPILEEVVASFLEVLLFVGLAALLLDNLVAEQQPPPARPRPRPKSQAAVVLMGSNRSISEEMCRELPIKRARMQLQGVSYDFKASTPELF